MRIHAAKGTLNTIEDTGILGAEWDQNATTLTNKVLDGVYSPTPLQSVEEPQLAESNESQDDDHYAKYLK